MTDHIYRALILYGGNGLAALAILASAIVIAGVFGVPT